MPSASGYEMLPFGTTKDRLLGNLLEFLGEGRGWLEAQRPAADWDKVLDMLSAGDPRQDVKNLSNTGYSLVTRNARDIVASLSNFRHDGEYRPRFDKALYNQAHVVTKLDRNWYVETHAYEAFRANLQNAVTFGTGYLVEDYDKHFHGSHGDIRLRAFGPDDVTFVQLPRDHDIQKAYMVIIKEEMPINQARAEFKNIRHLLAPDRNRPGWFSKARRKLQELMGGSPILRLGSMGDQENGTFETVDVFHAYTLDRSINLAPGPVTMGTHGTNWSYEVPALGSPIKIGVQNPATGQEWTRPAEEDDCKLFPLRRYTIFTRTAVAYDGSSPWWHGDVPVARVRFNDWAWEALGKSLLSDARTMQDGIVALMRYIEDASAARLRPPLLYDDQLVGTGFANAFDPGQAGAKAAVTLSAGDVVKVPFPVAHYDVPVGIYDWIKAQESRINHQMGTPDLVAVAKAKQVPGEGTLEKLMEMAGPLVQDMVRAQEIPYQQLGHWRLSYYFQFFTRSRILQLIGEDGYPEKDEDGDLKEVEFSPDQLVAPIAGEDVAAKTKRTKDYIKQFKYVVTESGIHEMHRLVNRLALLQLKKAGVKIDTWTIAKAWKIGNYGPEPEGTHTVVERWLAEQHMDRELMEELGAAQGAQKGRPPTNQKAAQLVSKDSGTRTTLKTS